MALCYWWDFGVTKINITPIAMITKQLVQWPTSGYPTCIAWQCSWNALYCSLIACVPTTVSVYPNFIAAHQYQRPTIWAAAVKHSPCLPLPSSFTATTWTDQQPFLELLSQFQQVAQAPHTHRANPQQAVMLPVLLPGPGNIVIFQAQVEEDNSSLTRICTNMCVWYHWDSICRSTPQLHTWSILKLYKT